MPFFAHWYLKMKAHKPYASVVNWNQKMFHLFSLSYGGSRGAAGENYGTKKFKHPRGCAFEWQRRLKQRPFLFDLSLKGIQASALTLITLVEVPDRPSVPTNMRKFFFRDRSSGVLLLPLRCHCRDSQTAESGAHQCCWLIPCSFSYRRQTNEDLCTRALPGQLRTHFHSAKVLHCPH